MSAPESESRAASRRLRGGRRRGHTLAALLQALQGETVTLELRNETCITGRLQGADQFMNTTVEDALWQPLQGTGRLHPFLFIKGRQLRYVHLPRDMDPGALLARHRDGLVKARVDAAKSLLASKHGRQAKGEIAVSDADAFGVHASSEDEPG